MYAVKPTQQTNTHTLFLIHEAYSNCANRHKTHIQISTKSTENTAARLGVAHFVHSWSTMRPFVLNLNALHLNGCLCKICVIKTIVFFFEIDKNILETYKHWCLFLFVCFHRLFEFSFESIQFRNRCALSLDFLHKIFYGAWQTGARENWLLYGFINEYSHKQSKRYDKRSLKTLAQSKYEKKKKKKWKINEFVELKCTRAFGRRHFSHCIRLLCFLLYSSSVLVLFIFKRTTAFSFLLGR